MYRIRMLFIVLLTTTLACSCGTFEDTSRVPRDNRTAQVDKRVFDVGELPPILIAPNNDPWGNISRETWDWLRAEGGKRVGWLCKLSHHHVDPDLDFEIDVDLMRSQLRRIGRERITPVAYSFGLEGPYTEAIRNPKSPNHERAVKAILRAIEIGRAERPADGWAFRGMLPNGPRQLRQNEDWVAINRAMRPVWEATDYIYLNLYTWRPFPVQGQENLYREFVRLKVELASNVAPGKPIIACVWHRHRDPGGSDSARLMSIDDWRRSLEIIRGAGIKNVSWWGADRWMSETKRINEEWAELENDHRKYAAVLLEVFG